MQSEIKNVSDSYLKNESKEKGEHKMSYEIEVSGLYQKIQSSRTSVKHLSSVAEIFSKNPLSIHKEGYLSWKSERKSAYREISSIIRTLKGIARTHGFSQEKYDQPRAQSELIEAKDMARDLMEALKKGKEANAVRYRSLKESSEGNNHILPSVG